MLRIVETGPVRTSRLHLRMLEGARSAERFTGDRGLAHIVPVLSKVFSPEDYLVAEVQGRLLKVFMRDSYWITPLLRTGTYEPEIEMVLRRTLDPRSSFIDCGANIGYWSILASGLIETPERVIALEANPSVAEQLKKNSFLNGEAFTCLNLAVWSRSGEAVKVAVDPVRHSWSSADPETVRTLEGMGFATATVQTITVDDAVQKLQGDEPDVVVVKIDIEGSEHEAIAGAPVTLQRDALVIFEEHGRNTEGKVTRQLHDMGLLVFAIREQGEPVLVERGAEMAAFMPDRSHGYNFCAARPGTEALRRLLLK